jgi:hypothetical protein
MFESSVTFHLRNKLEYYFFLFFKIYILHTWKQQNPQSFYKKKLTKNILAQCQKRTST